MDPNQEKSRKSGRPNGSTGPRTAHGKRRSSQNAVKHGFYAQRLYPNKELVDKDGKAYNEVLRGYWVHYAPVGDLEKLSVERIAVLSLRLARLLGHEQEVMGLKFPFEYKSADKIVRYESSLNRQLEKTVERLERLQRQRMEDSGESGSAESRSVRGTPPRPPEDGRSDKGPQPSAANPEERANGKGPQTTAPVQARLIRGDDIPQLD
jgi:hypothetical protein